MQRWDKRWIILGHRGFMSREPENSIKAFIGAIEAGADGIELDVWLTSDGQAVVSHDNNLKRVSGIDRNIKDSTLKDVKEVDIGRGERIPTLKEVFNIIPENSLVNIEIKDADAVPETLKIVESCGAKDRVMYSSFNIDTLREVRRRDKNAILGLLIDNKDIIQRIPEIDKELNLYSINLPIDAVTIFPFEKLRETILWLRSMNLKIVFWAEKDYLYYENGNIEKFKDIVDIVITDDVVKMSEHLFPSTKD